MVNEPFTTEEVSKVIQELNNWKAAERDGLDNFWKKQKSTQQKLSIMINQTISNPREITLFLTQGT